MGFLSSPLLILEAILALGILIIVHESGHYFVARWSGMRVDRFSIGFGPTLWQFKRGETIFQIAAIPLGGFVQIAGLTPGEEGMTDSDPRSYPNRPAWQRLATIFAGPATNYVFAMVVGAIVFMAYGVPGLGKSTALVQEVQDGAAATAGVAAGDEFVSVDGKPVSETTDIVKIVKESEGKPLAFQLVRQGKPLAIMVTPVKDSTGAYRVGVKLDEKEGWGPCSVGVCLKTAISFPIIKSGQILSFLWQVITRKQKDAGFGGPIRIVSVLKEQFKLGLRFALMTMAVISVSLGLFNLLPLPALDGGRIVFLGIELISRRRVNQKIEQGVHTVGMVLLLGLIVYVSFGDVTSLFNKKPAPGAPPPAAQRANQAPQETPTKVMAAPPTDKAGATSP